MKRQTKYKTLSAVLIKQHTPQATMLPIRNSHRFCYNLYSPIARVKKFADTPLGDANN